MIRRKLNLQSEHLSSSPKTLRFKPSFKQVALTYGSILGLCEGGKAYTWGIDPMRLGVLGHGEFIMSLE